MTIKEHLAHTFRDYFNNYITVEKFAEHNGLTETQARIVIALGKEIHEEGVAFEKFCYENALDRHCQYNLNKAKQAYADSKK